VPPMPNSRRYGAFHGADLFYVFDAMDYHREWQWTAIDEKLSDVMISYWIHFARTGDPNGKGQPAWPAFSDKAQLVMQLGDRVGAIPLPHRHQLDFWDGFYAQQRSGGK